MDEALLEKFRLNYPGRNFDNLKTYTVCASLEDEFSPDTYVEGLLANSLRKASEEDRLLLAGEAPAGVVRDGRPRMLKLTAFICHADVINGNRYLFTQEDLQKAVDDGLFSAPYLGMVDYDHDFRLYGAWYSAKMAFDPVANAPGVLAEGVIFAWRFPELADRMLAMQQRQGRIDVSVACDPAYVVLLQDEQGAEYLALREPVIFGTSVLDIKPADADARGLGTEDTSQPPEERELALALSSDHHDLTRDTIPNTEESMDFEKLEEMIRNTVSSETREQLKPIFEAAERIPGLESDLSTANARITELETSLATASAEAEEARLAAETVRTELATASEELVGLREFRSTIEAEAATAAGAALLDSRLAELSQNAVDALSRQPDEVQTRLKDRWKDLPSEEWDLVRQSLNGTAEPVGTYEAASRKEGILPTTGADKSSKFEIDKYVQ